MSDITPRLRHAGTSIETQALVKIGELAPDFVLKDHNDQEVRLSDYRNKKAVVLGFYPMAFSPVCTVENRCFSRDGDEFAKAGAEVWGVSTDSTWTLKSWAKELGLKHRLLADFHREVCKKYGLFIPEKNFSQRATVVVDKQGKVAWIKVQPTLGTARDNKEILEVLKTLH